MPDKNTTDVTHNQLMDAMDRIMVHRQGVVKNITYASQISGEDIFQYRKQLKIIDDTYNELLEKVKSYKIRTG